jgi:GT2 family glycosyltransferase
LQLTVVLPVHNEQPILEDNVNAIAAHLTALAIVDRFEIVLVCNGCTDDSERIAAELSARRPNAVRSITLVARGLGHAIREGIRLASCDHVMFYAVDLPFGLAVIDDSLRAAADAAAPSIVIGSKGHPDSAVQRGFARELFSSAISVANRLLFGLAVKDTQGSLLFPRAILTANAAALDSGGAFFQAQLVIYGHRMGYNVIEIPVQLSASSGRKTRFKLAADGLAYLYDLLREKRKLTREGRGR